MSSVIRNPGEVYRSVDPGHLAIVRANEENRAKALRLSNQMAKQHFPEGVSFGHHSDDGSFSMTGIATSEPPSVVPEGWRRDTKALRSHGVVHVPRMSTPEGKALKKAMGKLGYVAQPLGTASKILVMTDGEDRYFCSATIEVVGEQVFATYHLPLDDKVRRGKRSDRERMESDPAWEFCPLSEFYAAREQAKE